MHKHGVTLTELMVTIAMIGIIAAIAVPGLGAYTERSRLRQQSDLIIGVITRARIKAMQEAPWRVIFDPGGRTYYAYCDRNANARLDAGEEVQGAYKLMPGINFGSAVSRGPNNTTVPEDGINFQDNRVVFNRMGGCNAGTLYLCSASESAAIRLMPASGSVLVWRYRGGWVSQ